MQYNVVRQYQRGPNYEIVYDLLDDAGNLIVGGLIRGVGPVLLDAVALDDLFVNKIIPEYEEATKQVDTEITEEVTDLEQELLTEKRIIKDKVIYQIKAQTAPTIDTVTAAMPEHDANFVAYLISTYIKASYQKGYIATPTWDAFVVDIQAATIEELEARR